MGFRIIITIIKIINKIRFNLIIILFIIIKIHFILY